MKRIYRETLLTWYKNRPGERDKTAMLLEFYLILHFERNEGSVTTSRKAIAEYCGWTFKTVAKAIEIIQEEDCWGIEETHRTITFTPRIGGEK